MLSMSAPEYWLRQLVIHYESAFPADQVILGEERVSDLLRDLLQPRIDRALQDGRLERDGTVDLVTPGARQRDFLPDQIM